MLLPLLLCLLPPPGAWARARGSLSRKCGHLQYWQQKNHSCVSCEKGYAHLVPLRGEWGGREGSAGGTVLRGGGAHQQAPCCGVGGLVGSAVGWGGWSAGGPGVQVGGATMLQGAGWGLCRGRCAVGRMVSWGPWGACCGALCHGALTHSMVSPGQEFTVNCGMRDTGGRFATPSQACPPGSFNDGQFLLCQPCSRCPPGTQLSPCTPLQDTQCCPPRYGMDPPWLEQGLGVRMPGINPWAWEGSGV